MIISNFLRWSRRLAAFSTSLSNIPKFKDELNAKSTSSLARVAFLISMTGLSFHILRLFTLRSYGTHRLFPLVSLMQRPRKTPMKVTWYLKVRLNWCRCPSPTVTFVGAIIVTNIWAMTHDENEYPDPFAFKPERFLDSDGKINSGGRVLAYGFGRR